MCIQQTERVHSQLTVACCEAVATPAVPLNVALCAALVHPLHTLTPPTHQQIAKNITLAGVGHVTLLDDRPAAELLGSNFLVTEAVAAGGQT